MSLEFPQCSGPNSRSILSSGGISAAEHGEIRFDLGTAIVTGLTWRKQDFQSTSADWQKTCRSSQADSDGHGVVRVRYPNMTSVLWSEPKRSGVNHVHSELSTSAIQNRSFKRKDQGHWQWPGNRSCSLATSARWGKVRVGWAGVSDIPFCQCLCATYIFMSGIINYANHLTRLSRRVSRVVGTRPLLRYSSSIPSHPLHHG